MLNSVTPRACLYTAFLSAGVAGTAIVWGGPTALAVGTVALAALALIASVVLRLKSQAIPSSQQPLLKPTDYVVELSDSEKIKWRFNLGTTRVYFQDRAPGSVMINLCKSAESTRMNFDSTEEIVRFFLTQKQGQKNTYRHNYFYLGDGDGSEQPRDNPTANNRVLPLYKYLGTPATPPLEKKEREQALKETIKAIKSFLRKPPLPVDEIIILSSHDDAPIKPEDVGIQRNSPPALNKS